MKRLLVICGCMDRGGAETFILKVFKSIDKTKYAFDFATSKDGKLDNEIRRMGGIIHRIPRTSDSLSLRSKELYKIIKNNKYEYVLKLSSNSISYLDLKTARKAGAKHVGLRSLSSNSKSKKEKLLNIVFRHKMNKIANIKIAPSDKAAIFLFGKKEYKKGNVKIINNGLEYKKYKFNFEARQKLRKQYGINNNCIVFGHVGRLGIEKNHFFMLRVFSEFHKNQNHSALFFVGAGDYEDKIKQKCLEYGIEKHVFFTGLVENANDYYSLFDIFLFPSFYEGMPNGVIEAQASDLPCLVSDTITNQCKITNKVWFLPINDINPWLLKINELCSTIHERLSTYDNFKSKGYLIEDVVFQFIHAVFKE